MSAGSDPEDREVLRAVPVEAGGEEESPFGAVDFGSLLDQAQRLQEQLIEAQQEAAAAVVEGRAGGGSVVVTMSGEGEPLTVHIDASVIDPEDADLLEDLVLAAMKDAVAQARELGRNALGDLGGLGGLFGGTETT